jgi:uncharacterized repeat protein (TIGR03803 family)
MKTNIEKLFLLPTLIAAVALLPARPAAAQTFTILHNFTNSPDGADPSAGLVLSGNTLYGTAYAGGNAGHGTIFAVNTDGTGYTNLYSFTGGSDGSGPLAGLVLLGSTLYGTASGGGTSGSGTVFAINTNGTGFTKVHMFAGGESPRAGLALAGNTLYGTTEQGGRFNSGTIFAVNTDSTGFTNLYSFSGGSDGAYPLAGLILSGSTLYGTAILGGSAGNGTVFAIGTNGTGFTILHAFSSLSGGYYGDNSDGADPSAGLVLSGNTLYGTATIGGNSGDGTLFANSTDSTFTPLYSFTATGYPVTTNSDGSGPVAGLILSGNTLYGTASAGGTNEAGTVFAINTDGLGFTVLHTFTGSGGVGPRGSLVLSGSTLYGTTSSGGNGTYKVGTVFSLSLAPAISTPQLAITPAGANVILTWPAGAGVFNLESATNLVPPVSWVIVSGQNVVTNPIAGTQRFYRLSQ